jgi:trans-aconitate methyltransferase
VRACSTSAGSGLFAQMIATRGCEVTGLDASEPLLSLARRRTPGGSFHHGDMEALPFPDESFDIVTGMNSFQYAADPRRALAKRTWQRAPSCRAWGFPRRAKRGYLAALKPLLPAPRGGRSIALSDEAALGSPRRRPASLATVA